MNKYRRFKYPFGGETPEEFAAARQQYYANTSADAYQQIAPSSTPSNLKHVEATIPEVKEYMERTGREVTDYINRNYRTQPDTRKGKLIRNHDNKYDYYKVGDRLYTRRKGTDTWTDISDNKLAVNRINEFIRKPNSSPKKNETPAIETKTTSAPKANVTPKSSNNNKSTRVSGANSYSAGPTLDNVRKAIYSRPTQFTPSKAPARSKVNKPTQPQGRRLTEPKTRPYVYHGNTKYNVYTNGKGQWIE